LLFTFTISLTAFATLFATSPHLECLCPDGSRKPICLSHFFGDAHCWLRTTEPAEEPACCCGHAKPTKPIVAVASPNASGEPSVSVPACGKELTQTFACADDHADCSAHIDTVSACIADGATPVLSPSAATTSSQLSLPALWPPADFIILHQRLRI
jgi:hypothetical protein